MNKIEDRLARLEDRKTSTVNPETQRILKQMTNDELVQILEARDNSTRDELERLWVSLAAKSSKQKPRSSRKR